MTNVKHRTQKIEMRVDPEFKQAVREKADSKHQTITAWIESVVKRALKRK